MSHVIAYKPCPQCRSKGNDNRGDNLVCYADGGAHCFACGHHEHGNVTSVWNKPNESIRAKDKKALPDDFTRDVPVQALKWLLQYGLPWSHWKDSIGYSPKDQRLIFLVGSPVQFSIGRDVSSNLGALAVPGAKLRRKWYVWGDSHRHCESIGQGERIVLVEDLISAHKIVASTQESPAPVIAIPLFGVEIHPCHLYYLRHEGKPVVLWLDKDQQGSVMKKANQLSVLTGLPVRTISTVKDPKSLTAEEIGEQLNA